jgi:hypothetical protein
MTINPRWWIGLIAAAVMAGYLAVAGPREPFADGACEVESVMVMDPNPTTYRLDPPFRVLRGGRVTLARQEATTPMPVVRVDLTIDGEHVVVYTRRRE